MASANWSVASRRPSGSSLLSRRIGRAVLVMVQTIWSLAAGVTFQVGDAPAGVNAVPLRVQPIDAVYAPASVDALPAAMVSRR